ncbi:MAG: RNA methyltransferase [Eubacteriaceae bacterium]|nr:RNA methyltransferase [Eubacteriaceae bacterium]
MREIRSKDNRIFKETLKLSQKKYRDREGLYIVEGENLVGEAMEYGLVKSIFVSEDKADFYRDRGLLKEARGDTYLVEPKLFDRLAQTETSQGILAVVSKSLYDPETLVKNEKGNSNYVVLDRLQDPGNIGTIIRTAEGAGYSGVMVLKGTADVFSPKTVRAAAGSVFRNPIIQVEDNRELRKLCDRLGLKLVVTGFDTDKFYFDEDISQNTALVIGNEGNGVSGELMEMSDVRIKIPMMGNLESLNASVAAAILMYETQRRGR